MIKKGVLKNGVVVYDKDFGSHNWLSDELLQEGLSKIQLNKEFEVFEIDYERIIGTTSCVNTNEQDEVFFARRQFRKTDTRFVKGKKPEPTNYAVIILKKLDQKSALIVTAFIGKKAEKEIGDPTISTEKEKELSDNFWANHALIIEEHLDTLEKVV